MEMQRMRGLPRSPAATPPLLVFLCRRIAVIEKFANFLAYRSVPQLEESDVSAKLLFSVYCEAKTGGRPSVDGSSWSRCVKLVGALTPHEVVDFQQMWLSPDAEARQFVLGEKPTKGGRRRRTTPQRKGAKEAGQEDPLLIGSTSSVLTMKHLLSDLWRTFDYTRKWHRLHYRNALS